MVEEPISITGDIRWFETFKTPIRDGLGTIIGTTGYSRDITEKKRIEAAIQNATRLESLGVLAGGIAHDFNNLLGGIFGYLSLAKVCIAEGKLENIPEYLTKATEVFGRARALTQQLLTFSKGGAPIRKPLRLAPLLKKWAQFALSGSSVVCRCAIADDLWLCDCDENQIGQVIDNIIINAKQAMPRSGEIILTAQNVSVKQELHSALLRNGDFVKISIKDDGVGIPKQILPRIFDPFFSTKEKGHGLGLTTCYSIATRHGGFIDVESEPGKGSAFHIFLPASINSVPFSEDHVPVIHKGSGTFLVMDDEEMIRKPIGDVLKLWGYDVACRETGLQAIDFLLSEIKANRKITGMLLDLTVPGGMGGKEAIGKIRELGPEIPVFVTSGYADDPVMANPKSFGFTASICKPFTVDELAGMLNEHLKT
jgi:signal transduction histidine kinase/CheY-like chemotaxis protein